MIHTAGPTAMGGEPDRAREVLFEKALQITRRQVPARASLMAYRVGLAKGDRKFFHDSLKQVLETPPSVWPRAASGQRGRPPQGAPLSHQIEKELF